MDRNRLVVYVAHQTNCTVQTGPFRGMKMLLKAVWAYGDLATKLLGVYEEELHKDLFRLFEQHYVEIVDVGAAEGYYAIGCALHFKQSVVKAYDVNLASQEILMENAVLNGVSDRVQSFGLCDPVTLRGLAHGRRLLIILDCEGGENELLSDKNTIDSLAHSDLIIECHDFINHGTTAQLIGKFFDTHMISIVYSCGNRNPSQFPFLSMLSDNQRWLLFNEDRPVLMNWIICSSKNPMA